MRMRMRNPGFPIATEDIRQVEDNKQLKKIFKKHSILPDKQKGVSEILARAIPIKNYEECYIQIKDNMKRLEKIDLDRLKKETFLLLENLSTSKIIPYTSLGDKELCRKVMHEAIREEEKQRAYIREGFKIKKIAGKRSIAKIKKHPRALTVYTELIKNLVPELNPLFRDKVKDRWFDRSRRKEKTFKAVAEILNAVFPGLNFTPEQVKARFHQS